MPNKELTCRRHTRCCDPSKDLYLSIFYCLDYPYDRLGVGLLTSKGRHKKQSKTGLKRHSDRLLDNRDTSLMRWWHYVDQSICV
jgi:hypothetical protein